MTRYPLAITSTLLLLLRSDGGGPVAFDKGQYGPDLRVGEHLLIGRHGAAIARGGMVFAPVLDDFEQPLVGMVPGVASLIVRWGREIAQWQLLLPIGLAFEIGSVTTGTKAGVHLLPQGDLLSVVWVGLAYGGGWLRLDARHHGKPWDHATQNDEQDIQPTVPRAG